MALPWFLIFKSPLETPAAPATWEGEGETVAGFSPGQSLSLPAVNRAGSHECGWDYFFLAGECWDRGHLRVFPICDLSLEGEN